MSSSCFVTGAMVLAAMVPLAATPGKPIPINEDG